MKETMIWAFWCLDLTEK